MHSAREGATRAQAQGTADDGRRAIHSPQPYAAIPGAGDVVHRAFGVTA